MDNREGLARLYVDFRQFATIYKSIVKGWQAQIIEIDGVNEKVVKVLKSTGVLTVEFTEVTKPGKYKVKLIGPKPFGLIGTILGKKSEIIESQEIDLGEGEKKTLAFTRRDVKTGKSSFRTDAPWRIEPESETIPILVEIVDLPPENRKIKIKSIHIYDALTYKLVEKEEFIKIKKEDGLELLDDSGHPTLFEKEEISSGIFAQNSTLWYRIIFLKHANFQKDKNQNIYIGVKFIFEKDSFETCLKIHIANDPLPKLGKDWFYGDIHYHSEFTNNLTEFGGPLRMAKEAGLALGLNWISVTDHSCDFCGDKEFAIMKDCVKDVSEENRFVLLGSEEITVKKPEEFMRSDFLHLLYHDSKFIEGGFGGTFELEGVFGFLNKEPKGFAIAAHPSSFPNWEEEDKDYETAIKSQRFLGLQIFNAKAKTIYSLPDAEHLIDMFRRVKRRIPFNLKNFLFRTFSDYLKQWKIGTKIWDKLLINGMNTGPIRRLFTYGGSDAHGDFNFGVLINPITGNLMTDNAFGKTRTLVCCNVLSEDSLIDSLKNGRCIVTDGPVVNFVVSGIYNNKQISGNIGQDIMITEPKFKIEIEWKSSEEFGPVNEIKLIKNGEVIGEKIKPRRNEIYNGAKTIEILQEENLAYYRIEAWSGKRTDKHFCFTNPIWVSKDKNG